MREYLEPISRDVSVKILYYVVSSHAGQRTARGRHSNAEVSLIPFDRLIPELNERLGLNPAHPGNRGEPRRIAQSPFLDTLRLGAAIAHLGHPEISAAIRYVERCRRELDQSLFRLFDPTPERWLINGSAGMGKSVLLAYAAAVLSSGYHLQKALGEFGTYKATEILAKIGFDISKGALAMAANSQKQLDSLRIWFEYFVREFQRFDQVGDVHFRRPEFLLFRDMKKLSTSKRAWAAVFIDEAHDLPEHAAMALKQAWDELGFYLIAACDRHQRLKLAGSDAKVINGFNFTNKSKRLRQVYRNPAPIYIASLALMFRWFAASGPKVVPSLKQLDDCFGFDVAPVPGQGTRLTLKNDAHPANGWRHTITRFEDAATAASLLRREKLSHSDVLWVRFRTEDTSFDYEKLQRDFTYHNCRTGAAEAWELNDKYIKGQDYPVVVIEGFPRFMDQFSDKQAEDKMWAFRRELYLCASRATCFLYIICDVTSAEEIDRINSEINSLLEQVSTPRSDDQEANGTRSWSFVIKETTESRTMAEFSDAVQAAEGEPVINAADDESPPAVDSDVRATDLPESISLLDDEVEEYAEPEAEHDDIDPEAAVVTEPSIPIANTYDQWPISEDLIPSYKWVLLINAPESVQIFAERLGCSIPDLVQKLKQHGLGYAPNSSIPVPFMRALAFSFECYPANTQQEYDAILAESEVDEEVEEDPAEDEIEADTSEEHSTGTKPISPPPTSQPQKKKWKTLESSSNYKPQSVHTPQPKFLDSLSKFKKTEEYPTGKGTSASDQSSFEEELPGIANVIFMKQPILVPDLAARLGLKPFNIMAELIKLREFPAPNQPLSPKVAVRIAEIHGFALKFT